MVKVDEAFELRYTKGKEKIEVLVDFDKLNEFKKNPEEIDVYDVLADVKIFKDQKKGDIAPENYLHEIFKTQDITQILKEILIKGECQIPTAYLNKLREEKKTQVINYIAENSINPSMRSKYTTSMIQREVDQIKYNFDPLKDFTNQAEEVLSLLKKRMPISMSIVTLEVSIPAQYAGNFYGPFRKLGKITKEYYDNQANLKIHIQVAESREEDVENFIKKNSNSEASYYVLR